MFRTGNWTRTRSPYPVLTGPTFTFFLCANTFPNSLERRALSQRQTTDDGQLPVISSGDIGADISASPCYTAAVRVCPGRRTQLTFMRSANIPQLFSTAAASRPKINPASRWFAVVDVASPPDRDAGTSTTINCISAGRGVYSPGRTERRPVLNQIQRLIADRIGSRMRLYGRRARNGTVMASYYVGGCPSCRWTTDRSDTSWRRKVRLS